MATMRGGIVAMDVSSSHGIPPESMMMDIEQPHHHDVLCGRGVTTNRHPGNESFRSLVSLNKELYVTSTKRQKMSISRSIVEAVRSLSPPGRFLEKNPTTGLWSDIGDRKAIEKTSQALRDGAAGLRKQLSEDLGDPDFLSAVFDVDDSKKLAKSSTKDKASKSASAKSKDKETKASSAKTASTQSPSTQSPSSPSTQSPSAQSPSTKQGAKPSTTKSSASVTTKPKEKDKPVKAKPTKKVLRRTQANPTAPTTEKPIIRKLKSMEASPPSPSDRESPNVCAYPRPPHSPLSPHSQPCTPTTGWTNPSRYHSGGHSGGHSGRHSGGHSGGHERPRSGPYISPGSGHGFTIARSRTFHDSPSRGSRPYNVRSGAFVLRHHHHQHPPQWHHHGPPRYPPSAPGHYHSSGEPSGVHPPQSPLPPGCHHFSPRGYVQRPPLSPSYPPHSYPGPDHYHSRQEYGPPPQEWWPPEEDRYYHHRSSLEVPVLGGERRSSGPPPSYSTVPPPRSSSPHFFRRSSSLHRPPPMSVPRDFSPPPSRSPRRSRPTPDSMPSVVYSSPGDNSEGYSDDERMHKSKARASHPGAKLSKSRKPTVTPLAVKQESGRESPMLVFGDNNSDHSRKLDRHSIFKSRESEDGDKCSEDEKKTEDHQIETDGENNDEMSPLPFDKDPVDSLKEVPEDILTWHISPCGPHD